MPRIALAQVNRECSQCGMPATAGRYCHDCRTQVATMIDDNNGSVSTLAYSEPRGGQVNA